MYAIFVDFKLSTHVVFVVSTLPGYCKVKFCGSNVQVEVTITERVSTRYRNESIRNLKYIFISNRQISNSNIDKNLTNNIISIPFEMFVVFIARKTRISSQKLGHVDRSTLAFRRNDNIKIVHRFQKFHLETMVHKRRLLFFLHGVTFGVFNTIRTIDERAKIVRFRMTNHPTIHCWQLRKTWDYFISMWTC